MIAPRVYPSLLASGISLAGLLCLACAANAATLASDGALLEGQDDDATPDLVEVFHCRFDDDEWDVNYDRWPDRWTRAREEGYPSYVRMEIRESGDPEIGRRLVILPDGASARASSPPIHVMPKFSYLLSLRMKVEGVKYGKAYVRLDFQDSEGKTLQQKVQPAPATGGWVDLDLPPYQPEHESIDRLVVHFDFERGERGDLPAEISIADLRLGRAPSIRIYTDSEFNVYSRAEDVRVTCNLSGIRERNPEVRFQLLDATNKRIGEEGVLELNGKLINQSKGVLASEIVDGYGSDKQKSYEGTIDWRPPIPDYGFYRIRAQMVSTETGRVMDEPTITVAVVRNELERGAGGEFGWSLPDVDRPLKFSVLRELLPLAGVHMVKMPLWFAPGDEARGDEFLRFADQLDAREIELVGILEDPTARLEDPLTTDPPPPVEEMLAADTSHWMPLIDHVITKLALRIRKWQLGRDDDTSFVTGFDGDEGLVDKIFDIRNLMFRFGQDVRVGIGWRWDFAREWERPITWDFEQMSGRDGADAAGLDTQLKNAPDSSAKRWVLVAPPEHPETPPEEIGSAADVERHEARVRDFVEQIIVAKVHGVDGVIVSDPFSGLADPGAGKYGVMNVDGTPGELLLPWRTCARLLGGAEHIGSVTLPSGSRNWIFKRHDGLVVMALWNHEATREELYLGDGVHVVDIWGKQRAPEETEGRHVIHVDRMPRFVIGLNESVARWRMETRFERPSFPTVFGVAHPNALAVKNTFPQGVGGTARLTVPQYLGEGPDEENAGWRLDPAEVRLSLAAGEAAVAPFETTLLEADHGPQPVRVDFQINADRDYRFSVWRELGVGLGDLSLEIHTELDPDGRLHVTQMMRNQSGRTADFKCLLYAPPQRRKRAHVFRLGPEPDKKSYTYLDGRALMGRELKLRVEEVGGQRVLIHRFTVGEGDGHPHDPPAEADAHDTLASGG